MCVILYIYRYKTDPTFSGGGARLPDPKTCTGDTMHQRGAAGITGQRGGPWP